MSALHRRRRSVRICWAFVLSCSCKGAIFAALCGAADEEDDEDDIGGDNSLLPLPILLPTTRGVETEEVATRAAALFIESSRECRVATSSCAKWALLTALCALW